MHHALSLSIIRGRGDVVTRFILLLSADAYAMQLCKQGLVCRIATIERRPAHQGARFGRFSTRRMLRRLVSATRRSGSLSGIAASAAAMSRCSPNSSARVRRNNVFRGTDLVLWPRGRGLRQRNHLGSYLGCTCRCTTQVIFGARYELPTARPRARISDEEVSKRKRCSGISMKRSA